LEQGIYKGLTPWPFGDMPGIFVPCSGDLALEPKKRRSNFRDNA